MTVLRGGALVLLFFVFVVPGFAQSTGDQPSAPTSVTSSEPDGLPRPNRRVPQVPCWRQAGLTADMVNQRWKLEDQAKVKVAAACSEPSTSAQQKHDKIEQIHAETDQAVAKIIPSKELQAFNSCQAALAKSRPKPAGQKELGPCGGTIPSTPGAMDHEHH